MERQITTKAPQLGIIGAGVIGVTLALEASKAGIEVTLFERHSKISGASVRNFGLIWVSGRSNGEELRLSLKARQKWEELSKLVPGIGFRACGSITLLNTQAELDLAKVAISTDSKNQRKLSILDAHELHKFGLDAGREVIAGLHCELDASIEPKQAVPALVEHLTTASNFEIMYNTEVSRVNDGTVTVAKGESYDFDAIVATTGANYGGFLTRHTEPDTIGLGSTRLIMAQSAPVTQRIGPVIADADPMKYYPFFSFENAPTLEPQKEAPASHFAKLLMVQRLDGAFTLGDAHTYDLATDFEIDLRLAEYFITRAQQLLPNLNLKLSSVWDGVYSRPLDPNRAYVAKRLQDNFLLVTGTGGRGMTLAPAIADETLEWLSNYFARTM